MKYVLVIIFCVFNVRASFGAEESDVMHKKSEKIQMTGLTKNTLERFSSVLKPYLKEGMKIAVLGGSRSSGIGTLGDELILINNDSSTKPTIQEDFLKPSSFIDYEGSFDVIITERVEPENTAESSLYKTAHKLLKPDGTLIAGMYDFISTNSDNVLTEETKTAKMKINSLYDGPFIQLAIPQIFKSASEKYIFEDVLNYGGVDSQKKHYSVFSVISNIVQNNGFETIKYGKVLIDTEVPPKEIGKAKENLKYLLDNGKWPITPCYITETTETENKVFGKARQNMLYCIYKRSK